MKYPERPLRYEPSLESHDYPYYDQATVVQEDGRIAAFVGNSHERAKGWVFCGWMDSQGFWILEGERQTDKFAQTLLDSTDEKNKARHEARLEAERQRVKKSPKESAIDFSKFAMPAIANVAPGGVLTDLVSVQPMKAPTASVFKLEFGPYVPPPPPTVGHDEDLHAYRYGGILSERGGWFVTKKGDLTRVLRYRQDMMS